MKQAYKQIWVQALMSGEYKQITNRLSDNNGGFCLLGVLREQLPAELKDEYPDEEYLTPRQRREVGLSQTEQRAIAAMNDKGVPFEVAAGLICEAL